LLGLARSSLEWEPARAAPEDARLVARIELIRTESPLMGSRKLARILIARRPRRIASGCNCPRAMGPEALYCRRMTAVTGREHNVHP